VIGCAEDFDKYIALPRGSLEEAVFHIKSLGIHVKIRDERFKGNGIFFRAIEIIEN
jgi:hypothetical protein